MPFPDEVAPVAVVDYRPSWADGFEALAARLAALLADEAVAIDHVGSTSVPGLASKDCIDVQVRVRAIDEARIGPRLAAGGFRLRPEPWNRRETSFGEEAQKLVFAPPPGERACNVHVRRLAGAGARFALMFRDYLRADAAARQAWGAFKRRLAEDVTDLAAYGQIKAPATELLMIAAQRWAAEVGWRPG